MLNFDPRWRFTSPHTLPDAAVEGYVAVIGRIASQRVSKPILERFKRAFSEVGGIPYYASSSDWFIDEDLRSAAWAAAVNAPMFIDAVDTVISQLRMQDTALGLPDDAHINTLLADHGVPYRIDRPELVPVGDEFKIIVPPTPPTIDEQARALIFSALVDADRALVEGRLRDAVQGLLWVLETFSTAFNDPDLAGGSVEQSYFNKIVGKLRERGTANGHQVQILSWMMGLHGYLSSPTGGGIRHGTDVSNGRPLDSEEARLFCNLAKSYLVYLIAEYERMTR